MRSHQCLPQPIRQIDRQLMVSYPPQGFHEHPHQTIKLSAAKPPASSPLDCSAAQALQKAEEQAKQAALNAFEARRKAREEADKLAATETTKKTGGFVASLTESIVNNLRAGPPGPNRAFLVPRPFLCCR